MNTYVKSFESINESMKQHGIVLIKGKPRGKHGEQMLYATHVNTWTELMPGAVMLFLSDTFYRIVKDGDKLKGVKINWRDEDSLKAALNFKSPGKISVVRNNNKTPYHWKTLKHTNLRDALDSVEGDFTGTNYLFESISNNSSLYETVLSDAVDAIFREGENVVVLNWDIPEEAFEKSVEDEEDGRDQSSIEWQASFDCIYVGRPELDDALEKEDLRRFEITVDFASDFSYNKWYDSGDRDTPADGDIEVYDIETEITLIQLNGEEFSDTFDLTKIVATKNDSDLQDFINRKHVKFI